MKNITIWTVVLISYWITSCNPTSDNYTVADSPILTDFAQEVDPENSLPEYPRPQMVREAWMNLNGLWKYKIDSIDFTPVKGLTQKESWTNGEVPQEWNGDILVPFAIDAPLSGVGHILRPDEVLWYQKAFKIPSGWDGKRLILHFQASDWETSVFVNGKNVGQHRGGYDPFFFDISDYVDGKENLIQVCVWDATEGQSQAIGKQIMPENRKGFRYQPTGGIWQTVWIEPVAENYLKKLQITPDYDQAKVYITGITSKDRGEVRVKVLAENEVVAESSGKAGEVLSLNMDDFKSWSPENPFLYDLQVVLMDNDQEVDKVESYFGMRKIEVKEAPDGFMRIHLNDQPIFQYGPLDQGYWPGGILTPPSEEAIKFDLEYLKKINCNMIRVHIKTHPDRWYYWADKLGILVWQDMTCMPKYGQKVDKAAAEQWHRELKAMVDWLGNHPSVTQWIIFNEAWSQHNTEFYSNWLEEYDTTRLVTAASGWTDFPTSDVMDVHDYTFYPRNNVADYKLGGKRALLIGEAGALNLAVPGHTWYSERFPPEQKRHQNYEPVDKYDFKVEAGRHTYASSEVFEKGYAQFIKSVRLLNAGSGANGLVYTQITDVEHELNGWLTYDRKVSKIPVEKLAQIHEKVYITPKPTAILPFGETWRMSVQEKGKSGSWRELDFDDRSWKNALLPVGEQNAFMKIKTDQKPPFVMRKKFSLSEIPDHVALAVKGTLDSKIYLNGELLRVTGLSTERTKEPAYNYYPLMNEEVGLAPNPVMAGGGMPAEKVKVKWEVSDDESFRNIIKRGTEKADPKWGHSVHVEVDDLEPDHWYYYRFKVGEEVSPTGRTKTAPAAGANIEQVNFAFASCQSYPAGYYTAYHHLVKEDLDVVFFLGDYIYEGKGSQDLAERTHVPAKTIYSLEEYRIRYGQYKSDPALQAAHAAFPWIVTLDDHEVKNNWGGKEPPFDSTEFLARRAAGLQAFYENMPLRKSSRPDNINMQIYRKFSYGNLVEFSVLDTRQYRSSIACTGKNEVSCAERLDPARTMLGDEQEKWLYNNLESSSAHWNVLAQQVIIAQKDMRAGPVKAFGMDKWDGFIATRDRLLDVVRKNEIKNMVVLTGDSHQNWVNDLKDDFNDPDSATIGTEFGCTSISSGGDGRDLGRGGKIALAENPHTKFSNSQRGYVLCNVTRDKWQTDFRVVPYVEKPDALIATRASFVVENGKPGAVEV